MLQFELRELKRRQEEEEALKRAQREKEEAERLAALAAAQPEPEQAPSDRPDSAGAIAVEERPGAYLPYISNISSFKIMRLLCDSSRSTFRLL